MSIGQRTENLSRRDFLKISGSALGAAALAGCVPSALTATPVPPTAAPAPAAPASAAVPVHIEWQQTKCSNCLSCVVVCSERHTGTSAPSRARIRILVDLLTDNVVTAQYCRQCADAPCAEVCPEEAITFGGTMRAWLVDEKKCVACGACVDACPYQAIVVDPVTDTAAKCDLCDGLVRCVEICPTQALVLLSA